MPGSGGGEPRGRRYDPLSCRLCRSWHACPGDVHAGSLAPRWPAARRPTIWCTPSATPISNGRTPPGPSIRSGRCAARVQRIIYLGGLGDDGHPLRPSAQPPRGREAARTAGVPVTVIRAGIIVGHGGISWEMTRQLVEHLPAMITPKWVATAPADRARRRGAVSARGAGPARSGRPGLRSRRAQVLQYITMLRRVAAIQRRRLLIVPCRWSPPAVLVVADPVHRRRHSHGPGADRLDDQRGHRAGPSSKTSYHSNRCPTTSRPQGARRTCASQNGPADDRGPPELVLGTQHAGPTRSPAPAAARPCPPGPRRARDGPRPAPTNRHRHRHRRRLLCPGSRYPPRPEPPTLYILTMGLASTWAACALASAAPSR